jgi:hypothetical protein
MTYFRRGRQGELRSSMKTRAMTQGGDRAAAWLRWVALRSHNVSSDA